MARALARIALLLSAHLASCAKKPKGTLPEITTDSWADEVGGARSTIVEFYAPWCEACHAFSPVMRSVVAELGNVNAGRVDGDAQAALRSRFKIREAPSIMLFAPGAPDEAVATYDGALERAPFLEWARAELARLPSSKAADEGKATVDRLAEELTAALRRERDRKASPGPSSIDAQLLLLLERRAGMMAGGRASTSDMTRSDLRRQRLESTHLRS